MKKISLLAAGMIAALSTVSAVTITNPLTLSTRYVVGILNGQPGATDPTTEQGYAQTIIDLSLGEVDGAFAANTVFDYSGTITVNGGQSTTGIDGIDGVPIPAGWGGALAKYDGPNGGYVLFLFGGTASNIPEFPYDFWTTDTDKYQISHYTLFSGTGGLTPTPTDVEPVPEGGVGIGLFGLMLAGMGAVRARLARRKA